ncbi:hypothetical protein ACWEVP_45665 [Amycolatopsis sp. NPDC003865]
MTGRIPDTGSSDKPQPELPLPSPQQHRRYLSASPLRDNGQPLPGFLDFIDTDVAAYPGGDGHPAFFAWIPPRPRRSASSPISSAPR